MGHQKGTNTFKTGEDLTKRTVNRSATKIKSASLTSQDMPRGTARV